MIRNANHLCDRHGQPKPIWWRAHGSHKVASFAFPPEIGSTRFLATKHPTDVCPLTGRMMLNLSALNPYLPHYRIAFASSVFSPHTSNSMPYG